MSNKIVYTCPFVPAEWTEAHGLAPSRIMPSSSDVKQTGLMVASDCLLPKPPDRPIGPMPGLCPFVRAFINAVINEKDAAAIIVTTPCDQMRRADDIIREYTDRPVFQMNIPHTWQNVTAQKMYQSELNRLSQFLTELGGKAPSDEKLSETMHRYDSDRTTLKNLRSTLPARSYSEAIAEFNRTGKIDINVQKSIIKPSGVPLALVGGPLMADHLEIFDLVESTGGYIALDATETGERTLPAPFDRRQMKENPISALVDAYFGSIPDAFQRPNSRLYSRLKHKLAARDIKGIIFRRYLWCDTWNAEAFRMKEWSRLPFIHLDVSDDGTDTVRTLGRLRSFMETLE